MSAVCKQISASTRMCQFLFSITYFYLPLIPSQPSLFHFNSTYNQSNITNITANATSTPWWSTTEATQLTTSDFQTSASPTVAPTTLIPNDTTTLEIILHFEHDNTSSLHLDEDTLIADLTDILHLLLLNATFTDTHSYILSLRPILNDTNISSETDISLKWHILILDDNDTAILIDTLIDYLSSISFIEDFNENLNESLQLINVQSIRILFPALSTTMHTTEDISFSSTVTTIFEETAKTRNVLPAHLGEFMLLYVVLFCLLSFTALCVGCWCCTKRVFGTDKFKLCVKGKSAKSKGPSYNNLNASTRGRKWEDIDKSEAEYMMKAFDDDEAMQAPNLTDRSEEIQLTTPIKSSQDVLSVEQKLDIHKAFDED